MVRLLPFLLAAAAAAQSTPWEMGKAAPPPEWALLQRHLLREMYPAAREFLARYTRPDLSLIWRDKWPGMDGSDDGYESYYNFPLYYALGGPADLNPLSRRLWDAVTLQFTRYGQVYQEFDAYYDWMHHGESYVNFYFFGLADPADPKFRARALRFAGFYLNETPGVENWDAEKKLIRSPITGSRGPRFENSAGDWVTHRPVLAGYPLPYDDIPNVKESKAWVDDKLFPYILQTMNQRMMRGDVPLNLTATSLMVNAYMYTGDEKYRRWVLDYVQAWTERVRANNGIMPDNVGLAGRIGENMGGKWWGGYYGWRWPHGLFNILESATIGASNALLMSGDTRYLDLPRSQINVAAAQAREEKGRKVVPQRYSEKGWYDFRPIQAQYPVYLWYLSQSEADRQRVDELTETAAWVENNYRKAKGDDKNEGPWMAYLEGRNPAWPAAILRANYAETLRRLQMIRADRTPVDRMDVHHWQDRNPVVLEGLVQQQLGGPNHIYHGGLLHTRLRWFDPLRKRPGVPPDFAALVEKVTPAAVTFSAVNLHPSEARAAVVQAGMFAEHEFEAAVCDGERREINARSFALRLKPGAAARCEVTMKPWAHRPSYAFPWSLR
jgi:hypothetical protein